MRVEKKVFTLNFGTFTAGEEKIQTVYEVGTNEVAEIEKIEIFPTITSDYRYALGYVTPLYDENKEIQGALIRIPTTEAIPDTAASYSKALPFGKPVIKESLYGRTPSAPEMLCPKYNPGREIKLKVKMIDAIDTNVYVKVHLWVCDDEFFAKRIRGTYDLSFTIYDKIIGRTYRVLEGTAVTVSELSDFEKLPVGCTRDKPRYVPFIGFAINRNATTPNRFYELSKENVTDDSYPLYYTLRKEDNEIYVIERLAIHETANLKSVQFRSDVLTYALEYDPEELYPMVLKDDPTAKVINGLKKVLVPPIYRMKGGLGLMDTGTSIAAGACQIDFVGIKIEW